MVNEESQNERGGYQIDDITHAKADGTLIAYMCAQGDVSKIEKLVLKSACTKWMAPNKCHGIFFMRWSGEVP